MKKGLLTGGCLSNDVGYLFYACSVQNSKHPPELDRLAKILSLILLLAGAVLFVWGADKGFDFTDEGLYLLVYQHPHEFPDSYTSYHRVGSVIFDIVGGNIIALRLIGFFSTALVTFYFGLACTWFLSGRGIPLLERRGESGLFHLALQASVLVAYCWLPPTPNYNTMAGIGMLLSCGGILAFFSTRVPWQSPVMAFFAVCAMGAGLLLAFLAKGSSAVGIVVISGVLLGMCSLVGAREKVVFVVVTSVFVMAGGLCVFLLMPGLFKSWEFFLGSIAALAEGDGARGIIERHWQESLDFAMRHLRSFVLPVVLALGVGIFARSRFLEKSSERKEEMVFWMVIGVLAVEVVLLVVRETYVGGIPGRQKGFIGYTSLFLVLLTLRAGIPGFSRALSPTRVVGFLVFLLWLVVLPFVTAAGTTHKIFINALLHAAPIFAAIMLVASTLDRNFRQGIVVPTACVLIVLMGFVQFFTGFVTTPYRTSPKWTQTVPVEIGVPGTVLKVDLESAEFLENIKAALRKSGFKSGDDILVLYGLPGIVYAVGGVSPQRPWFFDAEGNVEDANNLKALQRIPKERLSKAYVLLKDNDSRAAKQLLESGIAFPKDYMQVSIINFRYKTQKDIKLSIFKSYEMD